MVRTRGALCNGLLELASFAFDTTRRYAMAALAVGDRPFGAGLAAVGTVRRGVRRVEAANTLLVGLVEVIARGAFFALGAIHFAWTKGAATASCVGVVSGRARFAADFGDDVIFVSIGSCGTFEALEDAVLTRGALFGVGLRGGREEEQGQ